MEFQELIPNFFRAGAIIFIIFKVQQHINLKRTKENFAFKQSSATCRIQQKVNCLFKAVPAPEVGIEILLFF